MTFVAPETRSTWVGKKQTVKYTEENAILWKIFPVVRLGEVDL